MKSFCFHLQQYKNEYKQMFDKYLLTFISSKIFKLKTVHCFFCLLIIPNGLTTYYDCNTCLTVNPVSVFSPFITLSSSLSSRES